MDTKSYFERAHEYINNLSDKEFMELLNRVGLKDCPYEDETLAECLNASCLYFGRPYENNCGRGVDSSYFDKCKLKYIPK
ncbi:MAG: hypothetical protein Q8910_00285 [Bacteroidota bacterium]|nr:hypothetical protein [Bacteroidota bacterium]